jgi:hypothetical protein
VNVVRFLLVHGADPNARDTKARGALDYAVEYKSSNQDAIGCIDGTAPLNYQWKGGRTAINGATNNSYTIPPSPYQTPGSATLPAVLRVMLQY